VRFDGVKIELFQTPTFISHMCMVKPNGEIPYSVTGENALRALQSYLQWIESKQNGIFHDTEVLQEMEEMVAREKHRIKELIKRSSRIEVYIM
jgi:hypothetical protein